MLNNQDRTFCSFYKDCKKGDTCFRAYSNVKKLDYFLPISVFTDPPKCFEKREKENV